MKALKSILFVFILLFAASFAYAAEDFVAYSQSAEKTLCACAKMQDTITVTNTGMDIAAFTVSPTQDSKQYSSLSEDFFILKPGESQQLVSTISAPCDFKGTLYINTEITSNSVSKKVLTKEISVDRCMKNSFAFLGGNSFVNEPCSTTRYDLKLANNGQFADDYLLSVEGIPKEYVQFAQNPIALTPGSSAVVSAYMTLPCERYGTFEGKIVSTPKNGDTIVKLPFILVIKRNYNYSLVVGRYRQDVITAFDNQTGKQMNLLKETPVFTENYDRFLICSDEEVRFPARLSNDVNVANTYSLSLGKKDAHFVSLSQDKISVAGKQSGVFDIRMKPSLKDNGNFNATLSVLSVRGEMPLEKQMNFYVSDCSSLLLSVPDDDRACCGNIAYPVVIKNTGTAVNNILLRADANASLSKETAVLNPGESFTSYVIVNAPCSSGPMSQKITISAAVAGKPSSENSASFTVDTVDEKSCNRLDFYQHYDKVFYETAGTEIKLSNNGIADSHYRFTLNASGWISLDHGEINLKKGETASIYLISSPKNTTEPGVYHLTLSAVSDNGFAHVFHTTLYLSSKTWKDSMWIYIEGNRLFIMLGFLLFALVVLLLILMLRALSRRRAARKQLVEREIAKKSIKERISREVRREVRRELKRTAVKQVRKEKPSSHNRWLWAVIPLIIIVLLVLAAVWIFMHPAPLSSQGALNESNQTSSAVNETYKDNLGFIILNDDITLRSADKEGNVYKLVMISDGDKDVVIDVGEYGCPHEVYVGHDGVDFKCVGHTILFSAKFSEQVIRLDYNFPSDGEKDIRGGNIFQRLAAWLQKPATEYKDDGANLTHPVANASSASGLTNDTAENMKEPAEESLYRYLVLNNMTNSFDFAILSKNTQYTINLSNHFKDPDMQDSRLRFISTSPMHVSISIDEEVAYLTPESDWHGIDYVTFTAIDSDNATVSSPEITLIVRDVSESWLSRQVDSIGSYFRIYMLHIVFGLLVLIVLILLLSMMPRKGKKKAKK